MGDRYRVLADGLNYPPNRRAEKGDIVDDLPIGSLPDLLSQGSIERADEGVTLGEQTGEEVRLATEEETETAEEVTSEVSSSGVTVVEPGSDVT